MAVGYWVFSLAEGMGDLGGWKVCESAASSEEEEEVRRGPGSGADRLTHTAGSGCHGLASSER